MLLNKNMAFNYFQPYAAPPLIPGDTLNSDATFTGSVVVNQNLSTRFSKTAIDAKQLSTLLFITGTPTSTLTTAGLLTTLIPCSSASAMTLSLPAATTLVADLKALNIPPSDGMALVFTVANGGSDGVNLTPGTGGSEFVNTSVATLTSQTFALRLSNTSGSTPTYVIYPM